MDQQNEAPVINKKVSIILFAIFMLAALIGFEYRRSPEPPPETPAARETWPVEAETPAEPD